VAGSNVATAAGGKSTKARVFFVICHTNDAKGGGVEIAIILGLVVLIFMAAAATVAWEDQRATRRAAARRAAALARLGELDGPPQLRPPPYD
jgi:hypothetical protein